MTHCIVCGYPVTHPLFRPDDQPLAALHLPVSAEAARNVARHPMHIRSCGRCGHIFNIMFDYGKVPYADNTNLMYNAGSGWVDYMEALADKLLAAYPKAKRWLEIGCGDGHFLARLLKRRPDIVAIGFEPGNEAKNAAAKGIEAHEDYFVPARDMAAYKPDVILCRHVIEHLPQPGELLSEISFWANKTGCFPAFFAEVPSIEKAILQARTNDYLYEHVSHFTARSFTALFERSGFVVDGLERGYADEVLCLSAHPAADPELGRIEARIAEYRERIEAQQTQVRALLKEWRGQGKRVAFWGGTGKSATFLNQFGITADAFPIVVDSDLMKCGRYVPGAAQRIESPELLLKEPVDIIVITTQWRAKDIYAEMQRRGIRCEAAYVLLNQQLLPYRGEAI